MLKRGVHRINFYLFQPSVYVIKLTQYAISMYTIFDQLVVAISSRPQTVMPPYPVLSFTYLLVTTLPSPYLRHYVNLVVVASHLSAFTFTEV